MSRSTSERTADGVATPIVSARTTSVRSANRATSSATTPGSTRPRTGSRTSTRSSRSPASRPPPRGSPPTRSIASASVAFPLRRLKVSVAANVTLTRVEADGGEALPAALVEHEARRARRPRAAATRSIDLLGAGHLRHAVAADEAHRLDARAARPPEPVDELGPRTAGGSASGSFWRPSRGPTSHTDMPTASSVVATDAAAATGSGVACEACTRPRRSAPRSACGSRTRPAPSPGSPPRSATPAACSARSTSCASKGRRRSATSTSSPTTSATSTSSSRRCGRRGSRGRSRLRPCLPRPPRRQARDQASPAAQDARRPLDGLHAGRRARLARDRRRSGEGLEPHDQAEHRRRRQRRHRGPRARRRRSGGSAARSWRAKRSCSRSSPDVDAFPICLATKDEDEIVRTVEADRAGLRRHQPRGHLRAAVLRDRATSARDARYPCLPRRPARHRDRRPRGAAQRAARRRQAHRGRPRSSRPAAAPPELPSRARSSTRASSGSSAATRAARSTAAATD